MKNSVIESIAIGSFDGMHTAHQRLAQEVDALVIIERNSGYLTDGYRRSFFTKIFCCFYHFDTIKDLSPFEFIEKLQKDFPLLKKIVVGYDFHFGKEKSGDTNTLIKLFKGKVAVIKEISFEDIPIHSRVIKSYLNKGNIKKVTQLLGREYIISGEVIRGQGLGKNALVPTLNMIPKGYQLPLHGVYATKTLIEDRWINSITFLGHRITTDGNFAVETHIIDKNLEMTPAYISIKMIEFIRENKKFETLAELKAQIIKDIAKAN